MITVKGRDNCDLELSWNKWKLFHFRDAKIWSLDISNTCYFAMDYISLPKIYDKIPSFLSLVIAVWIR